MTDEKEDILSKLDTFIKIIEDRREEIDIDKLITELKLLRQAIREL